MPKHVIFFQENAGFKPIWWWLGDGLSFLCDDLTIGPVFVLESLRKGVRPEPREAAKLEAAVKKEDGKTLQTSNLDGLWHFMN